VVRHVCLAARPEGVGSSRLAADKTHLDNDPFVSDSTPSATKTIAVRYLTDSTGSLFPEPLRNSTK